MAEKRFFCIDTGAEVTVISEKIYTKIGSPELKALDNTVKGALISDLLNIQKFHNVHLLHQIPSTSIPQDSLSNLLSTGMLNITIP